ncbi:hypothetical protein JIG36_01740 [Actinoplanes sp. LDG1-06]|uniref:Lipoprotein n=1 Tax=Paractinoplanes ovalisporus TaxID=2810368 RepID=A0ABS2A352_9ACTN|nr:hypothetical protein [Actinoplanes ovalisporus]MBM2614276.1 hypothetical protein [Actinoplanes ovalisporus]
MKRRLRTLALVCALAVTGCGGPGTTAYPTQAVPSGVTVTTSEDASAAAGPFEGTAAEKYPQGAAGITLPAAKAVKGFTAKEVTAALKKVRAAMIAARLEKAMLVEHRSATLLDLLAPTNRRDVATWFSDDGLMNIATWISPKAQLDPAHPPRVSGRITYASRMVDGFQTLQVTTNFIWVYAFVRPDKPIAAVHDEIVWEFTDPADVQPADRGMWIAEADSYSSMMDCAESDKGLLAPGVPELVEPTSSTNIEDTLKADHSLDIGNDC